MEEQKTKNHRRNLVLAKSELSNYELICPPSTHIAAYYVNKDEAKALFDGNLDKLSEVYRLENPFELGLDKIAEEICSKGEGIKAIVQRVTARNILKDIEKHIIGNSRSIDYNLSWTGLNSLPEEDINYLSERGLVEHSLN